MAKRYTGQYSISNSRVHIGSRGVYCVNGAKESMRFMGREDPEADFLQHSINPNCEFRGNLLAAKRYIRAWEELTINYLKEGRLIPPLRPNPIRPVIYDAEVVEHELDVYPSLYPSLPPSPISLYRPSSPVLYEEESSDNDSDSDVVYVGAYSRFYDLTKE